MAPNNGVYNDFCEHGRVGTDDKHYHSSTNLDLSNKPTLGNSHNVGNNCYSYNGVYDAAYNDHGNDDHDNSDRYVYGHDDDRNDGCCVDYYVDYCAYRYDGLNVYYRIDYCGDYCLGKHHAFAHWSEKSDCLHDSMSAVAMNDSLNYYLNAYAFELDAF